MVAGLAGAGIEATPIGTLRMGERTLQRPDGTRVAAEPVWRDELWRVLDAQA